MTNDEAIGVLEDVRDAICENIPGNHPELDELREAVQMAVDSLHERKKGKWTIGVDMPPMRYRNGKPKKFWPSFRYCSVCGHEAFDDSDWGEQLFDWCPYCGAQMDMRGGDAK